MYLADTNVFLEVLLDQEEASTAKRFLKAASKTGLHVTDFSLYSIGIILTREEEPEAFRAVTRDVETTMSIARARPDNLATVPQCAEELGLDFDDAYQYTVADALDLSIVSFDDDLDDTPRGRLEPEQALETL